MKESVALSPQNSLILVMGHELGEIPDYFGSELVAATGSCLAIGTLAAPDGETAITFADSTEDIEGVELVYDGVLSTPNKEVAVCDVLGEKLIVMPSAASFTRIKIFANDLTEPDQIVIVAQPA
ncbi:hypothetical protein [Luteimonas sp. RC10]|uniref:hypothetical protein n=1 Tax=Luteimonas sp. RC10 TaxID=2587035 RepID=UPI00160AE398|nr:hypothetical protein [Luteimonas sp. RC10]MBB3344740.1 hypothetical protein [Luteimonas sp. RC10]